MSQYTEFFEDLAYTISPDDDDYEEKLREMVSHFRPFDKALTTFITNHGYGGDSSNIEDKVLFLQGKFKSASIPVPRNLKNWFTKHIRVEPETAFQICFAFNLDIEQVSEFFRKVCLERGFDCHSKEQAIYYFCFRNGLTYSKAQRLCKQVSEVGTDKISSGGEVLYTNTIVENIDGITNKEDLIRYINDNIDQFGYNNATAIKFIRELWSEIAGKNGLAYREGQIAKVLNPNIERDKFDEDLSIATEESDSSRDDDDLIIVTEESDSIWTVYCQILGLDKGQDKWLKTQFNTDRSIKPVIKNSDFLHILAEDSFPDRDGINKVLNGEHVSHERIRKLIIFLIFYRYWAKKLVGHKEINTEDAERCQADINSYLRNAGYPELYYGNPYDWIFMWALNDDSPLQVFRYYIGELFAEKMNQRPIKT